MKKKHKMSEKKNFEGLKKNAAAAARWIFFAAYCAGLLFLIVQCSHLHKIQQEAAAGDYES